MRTGKTYWRSLDELARTPEFEQWLHREFPENASEWTGKASRRNLLKLMAASFGLAGLVACRRPVERILPAAKGVEEYVPGNPMYYATAFSLGAAAYGLHVEAHDGRPTKIEGNPQHPASRGAAGSFAQASILGLYDPDRAKWVRKDGRRSSWEEFEKFAAGRFAGQGAGLRFLSGEIGSPSLEAVKKHALQRFPQARWVEFEPVSQDEPMAGAQLAFGQPVRAHYHFEKADVILALDCDFLGLDAPTLSYTREFARRRKIGTPQDRMNRLYVAEANYSLTGAAADHRLRLRASEVAALLAELAAELKVFGETLRVLPAASGARRKWLAAVARDLAAHKGRCLVLAGPRQPAVVHAWVHLINQLLGNAGATVTYTAATWTPQTQALKELASEMAAGQVSTLVILGGNPVYNAPADLDFASHIKKVECVIRHGLEEDETAALAHWTLPEAHYLETWGDARAWDGTCSIQQPLVAPIYEGRSAAEVVALLSGYPHRRAYDIVRNFWSALSEPQWRKALHDGVTPTSPSAELKVTADARRIQGLPLPPPATGVEINFQPDAGVWDGRFANNGWLQEAPDPMTKLTWDNAALLSPATARSLGVNTGDMISIQREGRELKIPAMILPGHADNSITLPLGYGRTRCGRVGRGVGHNVYPLRTSGAMSIAAGGKVSKAPGRYKFSLTQDHHSMEGRPIVREATLEEYRKHPHFAHEPHQELFSLYPEHSYDKGNQWGMVVDLNACIGCNACLLACQAENNIPIVGKKEVARGREMHWIRLDRYFSGPEEDPEVVYQPMACQQCENAPCENVCPVAATAHSPEGLNEMAYNRCIGTRYCANNCPYKVRRFNFLEWHKDIDQLQRMQFNPDVTVRMRGVMEKCNYCVQRIQEAKIKAKAEGRRPIRDGEILTACQQTCPAEAIVFGNINDPNSKVSQLRKQDRNYAVLAELNVKPRTTYLAKVRNPNPELV